jgi:hypothetical protein
MRLTPARSGESESRRLQYGKRWIFPDKAILESGIIPWLKQRVVPKWTQSLKWNVKKYFMRQKLRGRDWYQQ